ncbi:hypothetical protein PD716_15790 [Vibrio gigantis]
MKQHSELVPKHLTQIKENPARLSPSGVKSLSQQSGYCLSLRDKVLPASFLDSG